MMGACLSGDEASEASEDNTLDGKSSIGELESDWYLDVARQVASTTLGLISTPTRTRWVIRMNWTYSRPDPPSICATGLAAKETTPRDTSYAFIRTSVLSCKSDHETINYSPLSPPPPIAFSACPAPRRRSPSRRFRSCTKGEYSPRFSSET
jgi:hypothetical protein